MGLVCAGKYDYDNHVKAEYDDDKYDTKYVRAVKETGYDKYNDPDNTKKYLPDDYSEAYNKNHDNKHDVYGYKNNDYKQQDYETKDYQTNDYKGSYVYPGKKGPPGKRGGPGKSCHTVFYSPPYPTSIERENLNHGSYVWTNSFHDQPTHFLGILHTPHSAWVSSEEDNAYWQMNFAPGDYYNLRILGVVTQGGGDSEYGYPNFVTEYEVEVGDKHGNAISLGTFKGNKDLETKKLNYFKETIYDPKWLRITPKECDDIYYSGNCGFAMRSAVIIRTCRGDDTEFLRTNGVPGDPSPAFLGWV